VSIPNAWLRRKVRQVWVGGSAEIAGATERVVGSEPDAHTPPLCRGWGQTFPNPDDLRSGSVNINYGMIRQKVRENAAPALRDVGIYPFDGKIVVGLRMAAPNASAEEGDWIYLAATPQINADAQVVQFADLALVDDGANSVTVLVKDSGFLSVLQEQLRIDYEAERNIIIASANERLSRPLGNGLRSEGRISSAGVAKVLLLATGLRLDLRAAGRLKILFGLQRRSHIAVITIDIRKPLFLSVNHEIRGNPRVQFCEQKAGRRCSEWVRGGVRHDAHACSRACCGTIGFLPSDGSKDRPSSRHPYPARADVVDP